MTPPTDRPDVPPVADRRGWGFPLNSKKAHYFIGGRSLCMKWMYSGNLEQDDAESPDDCAECRRRRNKTIGKT